MTRDDLVSWFIQEYPELTLMMQKTDHNYDISNPSKFHMESSVWTHTMMVMTVIQENSKFIRESDRKILLIAGLLHDTGKPQAKEIDLETKKHRFKGHEGISTIKSIGVLNKMLQENLISFIEREEIIKIISLHGINFEQLKDKRLKELLKQFRYADKAGAVRQVDEDVYGAYPERKYSKSPNSKSNIECIILTGLPCSGKSTYRKSLVGYFVISRDDELFNFADYRDISYKSYNDLYKIIHEDDALLKQFEEYFDRIINKAKNEPSVVVDMTMLSLSSRRKMMNKLGERKYKSVVFLCTLKETEKRNNSRYISTGKYISDDTMVRMEKSFVMPTLSEGFVDVKLRWTED